MQYTTVKPFIKWVGGKSQLISDIRAKYPSPIVKYCEPFVGGGAVLIDILANFKPKEVLINDINAELVNTYIQVRDNVDTVIELLKPMQDIFLAMNDKERNDYYYEKRKRFNTLKKSGDKLVEQAAIFIFINKTCFNGLYRVNHNDEYNVPMGSYKNPSICDSENLKRVSELLKDVRITCGDYSKTVEFIDENTFVYIDPPYRPLTPTSSFTSYAIAEFGDKEQIELCEFVGKISDKGAMVVLSNSDPKNVDENDNFFENLYSSYKIEKVSATRMINSKASGRGVINELLISNYDKKSNLGRFNMKRVFDIWLSQFRDSIASYDYYIDFDKVHKNVDDVKIELNILNTLIGSPNIETEFENIITRYPETLKCIPILLAVRANEIYAIDSDGEYTFNFKNMNYGIDDYKAFMRKTGLFDLLQNRIIRSLVDYVTGVETGLDSNGRKNRGGHLMENLVESYIQKAGFKKEETYFKEMYIHQIEEKWHIDLSAISNKGKAEKRFDFVIKTEHQIYVIETNFYASGGSKLNETARSYKQLAQEVDTIDGVTFVWFTDGKGWHRAKNNLEETFDVMKHIYNINDLENGIITSL